MSSPTPDGLLVVIPTFNEVANLELVIRRLRGAVPYADALVVDDASPDGTGELADKLAETDPAVFVLHRSGKQGLGIAYLDGFAWGLQRGYDILVQMDADGSHRPEELPRLLGHLDRADVVLGSRWVSGGQVRNWPLARRALSRGGNAFTRVALGLPLRDSTGGFRVFSGATLAGLDLSTVASQGYCFQVDLARRTLAAGFHILEVPITFVERERGESKMDRAIVVEALWRVTGWGLRRRATQLSSLVSERLSGKRPGR